MSVVLIGYRGTGKTTVGKLLAARWSLDVVDADCELEAQAGKSIAEIFADEGEPSFRDRETAVLKELVSRPRCVVSAGGGAVLREENREILRAAEWIVWLKATPETIADRVLADETTNLRRPRLTTSGGMQEIVALLAQREPLYRQMAHCEVDTDGLTASEVVDRMVNQAPEHVPSTNP